MQRKSGTCSQERQRLHGRDRRVRSRPFSARSTGEPKSSKASRGPLIAPLFCSLETSKIAIIKVAVFQLLAVQTAAHDYPALKVSPAVASSAAMIIGPRKNSPHAVLFVRSRRQLTAELIMLARSKMQAIAPIAVSGRTVPSLRRHRARLVVNASSAKHAGYDLS